MTSLIEHTMKITILDDSRVEKCDTDCGLAWSSAEIINLASQQTRGRFGDKVKLEYLDLAKATANAETLEWSQAIKNKNLPLPLLIINGQARISGQFDIRQLLDAIEAEIEIGA